MSHCIACNNPLTDDTIDINTGEPETLCTECLSASAPAMSSVEWNSEVLEFVEDHDDEILDELDLGG